MPSASTLKLLGGLAGLLILAGLVLGLKHYKGLAESRGEKLEVICKETRDASNLPRLKCADVPKQIEFMGQAIGTLTTALHKQNDAVAAMGAESERQKAEAERASRKAVERAKGPEATATRLDASSRSSERQAKPCEPSKALTEARTCNGCLSLRRLC